MNKLLEHIKMIGIIISIIIGIITLYSYINGEKVIIEIQTLNERLLTEDSNIAELSVNYKYRDSIDVKNLWLLQYIIRNNGNITIVGEGEDNIIIGDGIPLIFSDTCRLLSLRVSNDNNNAYLVKNKLLFKQWRKDEFVEITAFIESIKRPKLSISDRDIKDSEIIYSTYTPTIKKSDYKLIYSFPSYLINTSRVLYCIFMGALLIFSVVAVFQPQEKGVKFALVFVFIVLLIPISWMF